MINSYWWKAKGCWDQHWFINILEKPPFEPCMEVPPGEGAVFSFASDLYTADFAAIQRMIDQMPWVLLIITAREAALFPWRQLVHPRKKVWLQLPNSREIVPSGTRVFGHMPHSALAVDAPPHIVKKKIHWFFGGQNTNEHRRRCVSQLEKRKKGEGKILATAGFAQGAPFSEYVDLMASARIIPCPSGPVTASTFRVFEALECGSLPIADKRCPIDSIDYDFWKHMLGYQPPFPTVLDWSEIHEHLDRLADPKAWEKEMGEAACWWTVYKKKLRDDLQKDIDELQS